MDTDSVLFVDEKTDEGKWKSGIATGFCLGDFTDELDSNTWITEFVSTGPKSYAYKTNNGTHESCKVKGLKLSEAPSINFNSIKDMIMKYVNEGKEDVIEVPHLHFELNKYYDIHKKLNNIQKFQFAFDVREIDVKT